MFEPVGLAPAGLGLEEEDRRDGVAGARLLQQAAGHVRDGLGLAPLYRSAVSTPASMASCARRSCAGRPSISSSPSSEARTPERIFEEGGLARAVVADQSEHLVGVEAHAEAGPVEAKLHAAVDRHRFVEELRVEHRQHLVGRRRHHQELGERAVMAGDHEVVAVDAESRAARPACCGRRPGRRS